MLEADAARCEAERSAVDAACGNAGARELRAAEAAAAAAAAASADKWSSRGRRLVQTKVLSIQSMLGHDTEDYYGTAAAAVGGSSTGGSIASNVSARRRYMQLSCSFHYSVCTV
jgi:hypothetical protein